MPPVTTLPGDIQAPIPQSSPISRRNLQDLVSFNEVPALPSSSAYTPRYFDVVGASTYYSMFDSIDSTPVSKTEDGGAQSFISYSQNYATYPSPKSNVALPRDTTSDPLMIPTSTHLLTSPASDIGPELSPTSTELPSYSQCSCLSRAFWLLQKLSPKPQGDTGPILTPEQIKRQLSDQDKANHQSTERNKEHVEEIMDMVECTCAEDPYTLSLISLLAFKIMGLYKIAARELRRTASTNDHHLTPFMSETPTIMEYGYSIYNDKIRATVRAFLGEIRLVQQLVSFISLRLRRLGEGRSREQNAASSTYAASHALVGNGNAAMESTEEDDSLALPTSLLHQLEVDLRRQLRALSIETVGDG
ncbi:hypothetical protein F5Y12DRAFT_720800 [Xylaria sp. FL1777]|nr:hypothetical protein F5Y12DRAFT_720800 [Xylaria sp. FL1777]